MDDADLAGPLLFGFCFGMFLLLVRLLPPQLQSCSNLTDKACN